LRPAHDAVCAFEDPLRGEKDTELFAAHHADFRVKRVDGPRENAALFALDVVLPERVVENLLSAGIDPEKLVLVEPAPDLDERGLGLLELGLAVVPHLALGGELLEVVGLGRILALVRIRLVDHLVCEFHEIFFDQELLAELVVGRVPLHDRLAKVLRQVAVGFVEGLAGLEFHGRGRLQLLRGLRRDLLIAVGEVLDQILRVDSLETLDGVEIILHLIQAREVELDAALGDHFLFPVNIVAARAEILRVDPYAVGDRAAAHAVEARRARVWPFGVHVSDLDEDKVRVVDRVRDGEDRVDLRKKIVAEARVAGLHLPDRVLHRLHETRAGAFALAEHVGRLLDRVVVHLRLDRLQDVVPAGVFAENFVECCARVFELLLDVRIERAG